MKVSKIFMDQFAECLYRVMNQQSGNAAQELSHFPWEEAKNTSLGHEAKLVAAKTVDYLMKQHGQTLMVDDDPTQLKPRLLGSLVFVPYETEVS